jgi:hypothetical protein
MKARSTRTHFVIIRHNQRIGMRQGEPTQRRFCPLQKAPNR